MAVTHAPRVTEAAARAAEPEPTPRLPALAGAGEPRVLAARPLHYPPSLANALMAIRRTVQPVAKEGENKFHGYKYPKAEDVVDAVIPLLAEHGVFIVQSEVSRTLFQEERTLAVTYEYIIFNGHGDVWPDRPQRTGLGMVRDGKGTVDDKAANKASTQSEKYFYIKFFGIRTSDAAQLDNDSDERPKPNGGPAATPSPATARRSTEPPGPPDPPEPPQPSGGSPPPAARVSDPPVPDLAGDDMLVEVTDPDTGEITMRIETRQDYQLSTGGQAIPAGATVTAVVVPDKKPPRPLKLPAGTVVTADDLAKQLDDGGDDIPAFLRVAKELAPLKPADKPICHPAGFWVKRTKKTGEVIRHCSVCNSEEPFVSAEPLILETAFDEASWLRDVDGAACGCTTAAELDEVQHKVMLPVKTTVSQEAWSKARKIIGAQARRVFEENE